MVVGGVYYDLMNVPGGGGGYTGGNGGDESRHPGGGGGSSWVTLSSFSHYGYISLNDDNHGKVIITFIE